MAGYVIGFGSWVEAKPFGDVAVAALSPHIRPIRVVYGAMRCFAPQSVGRPSQNNSKVAETLAMTDASELCTHPTPMLTSRAKVFRS